MGVTLVSGVPGVGASAVCEAARRELGDGFELVNFGDVMLEQAAAHGLATERRELPALTMRETRRLQRRAAEYVADRAAVREVLLTTYLAAETDEGFVPGLPESALSDVSPDRFVLVEADPETILDRQAESPRSYEATTTRQVAFQQDLNRAAAVSYAMATDAPIRLLENTGAVAETAAELTEILRSVAE
jgi:adenylate kinase